MYLLRSEVRGETIWYELSHERLIKPILECNHTWRERMDPDRRAAALREAAESWAKEGKPQHDLPSGRELKDAERWLASAAAADIGVSETTREYLQTARRVADREATRRLRWQAVTAALAAIVFIAVGAEAIRARVLAEQARREAEHSLSLAHAQIARAALTAGRPLEATASAIRAVSSTPVSGEAVTVLRDAVRATGGMPWLRRPEAIVDVAVSVDGKMVATRGTREACVWKVSGRRIGCTTMPEQTEINWLYFSPGRRHLSVSLKRKQESGVDTGRDSFYAQAWLEISPEMKVLRGGLDPKASKRVGAFCRGDAILFLVGDGAISMEDTASGRTIGRIDGPFDASKTEVNASDDCHRFVTVSGNSVDLWDGSTMRHVRTLLQKVNADLSSVDVGFSPAGSILLYETFDRDFPPAVFDAETGNRKFELPSSYSVWYAFLDDGREIVTKTMSNEIAFYDAATGVEREPRFPMSPIGSFNTTHFFADTIIQHSLESNAVQGRVIDLSARRSRNFSIPVSDLADIAFSADGRIAALVQRGVVRIWNLLQPTPNYDKAGLDMLRQAACRTIAFQDDDRDLQKACREQITPP